MKSERISEYLQTRIEAGDFPSAVYLVAEKGEIIFTDALGFAVAEPEEFAANLETIYDLASLTKVLVTSLICARLIERKELELGRFIDYYLREFALPAAEQGKNDVVIEELLTHKSGFTNWKPFYLSTQNRFEILMEIIKTPLNSKQPIVTYSDLNFLVLTFLLEKLYGERIDKIAEKEIFAPLELRNTFYNPPKKLRERIAASEKGNEYEKQMCADLGFNVEKYDWRNYQIWGEVHDGNCYFMNGASGHAGLFSNVFEVYRIAQQFLAAQTTLLKPKTCALFRTNFTPNLNEARSIGFQLAATKDSTAGDSLAKNSFGHLGFTGTSLWIEPGSERIYILLTNRTHARSLPFANINPVRRRFHELAARLLNEKSGQK